MGMDTSSLLEGLNPSVDDQDEHDTFEDSLEMNFISSLRPQIVQVQPEAVAANPECQINIVENYSHEESTQMVTPTDNIPRMNLSAPQKADVDEEEEPDDDEYQPYIEPEVLISREGKRK